MANEVFATVKCNQCGDTASVMATAKGKSRYWYTNGCDCGCNQTTGIKRQSWLVDNADYRNVGGGGGPLFADGAPVPIPPNYKKEAGEKEAGEPYSGKASSDFSESDLEAIGKAGSDPDAIGKDRMSKGVKLAIFAGLTVVGGFVVNAIAGARQ